MSPFRSYNLIATALLLCSNTAFADSIILLSGDRISGEVVRLDEDTVVFNTNFAGRINVARNDVSELRTDSDQWLTLSNGERLWARMEVDRHRLSLLSPTLGQVTLPGNTRIAIGGEALSDAVAADIRGMGDADDSIVISADAEAVEQSATRVRENTRRFSQRSTALTPQGAVDLSLGFSYATSRRPAVQIRNVELTTTFQTGLNDRMDASLSLPVSHVQAKTVLGTRDASGVGNIQAGLRYLVQPESATDAEWVFGLSLAGPMDDSPDAGDPTALSVSVPYWSLNADLGVSKSYDPIVLYSLFGYQYTHEYDFDGRTIDPGDSIYLGAGLGFAVNNNLSLNGQVFWAHRFEGESAGGGKTPSGEPVSLRLGASLALDKDSALSGAVGFGLTDDATDASLSLTYSRRF